MTWIQTRSGVPWDLLSPKAADIRLPDIAHALSHINRFTGHVGAYSVAQHSVHVARIVADRYGHTADNGNTARAVLGALLHDAHEAYIGDMSLPVKQVFRAAAPGVLLGLELAHDRAIAEWAGIHVDYFTALHVKEADRIMLATERRDLLGECDREWPPLPDPLEERINPWPADAAADLFADCVSELMNQIHADKGAT